MDDFTVNVRQIGNYPASSAAGLHDLLLIQQNGLGGAYACITPADLVSTALLNENPLQLNPAAPIQWNGAALSFNGSEFAFSANLNVPTLKAQSITASADISVGGDPLATQRYANALVDALALVSSFNGRTGDVQLALTDILTAGGAPILDPHFGGHVTVPTAWNTLANDDTAASTAFVQAAICQQLMSGHVVLSYHGRSGNIMPIADDVTAALSAPGVYGLANTPPIGDVSKRIANTSFVDQSLAFFQTEIQDFLTNMAAQLDQSYAPLDSAQLTGIPTAPTAAQTVNSGQLATCAFVKAAVAAATTGVASFNGRTGAVVLTAADVSAVGAALLASPAFTGTPTAVTAAPGDASTKLATCAFVNAAITGFNAGVTSFNSRVGAVVLTTADVTAVGGALLASPALSGTPSGPTATAGTNTTQLATTAFVTQAIAALPTAVASFNGRTGAITFQASDISAVGGALLASPAFTGSPTAVTAAPLTNTTQLATCAFVVAALAGQAAGVSSFNTRTGAVTLTAADLTGAGGALLAGPTFIGLPAAPTAAPGNNTTQLATCAFVTAAVAAASAGVLSFNARTGAVTLQGSDISAAGGALTASPALTGNPTAPTPSPGDSDTSIATTGFVAQALASVGGVTSFNGRAGVVTLNSADISAASGALLASPTFTGTPAAPTAAVATNTTQLATTAFVANAIIGAAVRYDVAQALTAPQQAQARANDNSVSKSGDTLNGNYTINGSVTVAGNVTLHSGNANGVLCPGGQGFNYNYWATGNSAMGLTYGTLVAGYACVHIDAGVTNQYAIAAQACDERLKTHIAPSSHDCLDQIAKIQLYEFRWKDHTTPGQPIENPDAPLIPVGFISQRLYQTAPHCAVKGDDYANLRTAAEIERHRQLRGPIAKSVGLQSIGTPGPYVNDGNTLWSTDPNGIMAMLTGAVQQLLARVKALEAN